MRFTFRFSLKNFMVVETEYSEVELCHKKWGLNIVESAGSGEDRVSGLGKAGNFRDSVICLTAEYQFFRRCEYA